MIIHYLWGSVVNQGRIKGWGATPLSPTPSEAVAQALSAPAVPVRPRGRPRDASNAPLSLPLLKTVREHRSRRGVELFDHEVTFGIGRKRNGQGILRRRGRQIRVCAENRPVEGKIYDILQTTAVMLKRSSIT